MKNNSILLLFLGILCLSSCDPSAKKPPTQTPTVTQKVILLNGNYFYKKGGENVIFTNGNQELKIPFSSLVDGKSLFGDSQGNHLGALLLKDDPTIASTINDFMKIDGKTSAISLTNGPGQPDIVNDPPCPPNQKCPPRHGVTATFMEVNLNSNISVSSSIQF